MSKISTVLTIRVPKDIDRRLTREARRRRRTRSDVARMILIAGLGEHAGHAVDDPKAEARRQSLAASASASEADVLGFISAAADLRGWK